MSNTYWLGTKHAVLKKSDVSADWIKKNNPGLSLRVVNKAFCIWFHGINMVKKFENDPFSPVDLSIRKSIEYCADSGWGYGIDDLREGFVHLDKKNGKWTDGKSKLNYNGRGIFVGDGRVPNFAINFLKAVDATRPAIIKAVNTFSQQSTELSRIKIAGSTPTNELNTANKIIKAIGKSAKEIKKYAWIIPGEKEGMIHKNITISNIHSFVGDKNSLVSGTVKGISYAGTVLKILDLVETYEKSYHAFRGDKRMATCVTALSYALNYVPILGAFYGEYVKHLGDIAAMGTRLRMDKTRQLNGYVYQLQQSRRSATTKRCAECNSSFSYKLM